MSFYLTPPRGDIALDKLEELTLKRWRFLKILQNSPESLSDHPELSESVMENSSKDKVSHFFLKFAISKDLKSQFIDLEVGLFLHRISQLDLKELNQSLCEVINHIDGLETEDEDFSILSESVVVILSHYMLEGNEFSFKVPFYIVPNLVSKRNILLEDGLAEVTTRHVPQFLSCVYAKLLRTSLKTMKNTFYGFEEDDRRMAILINRIQQQIQDEQIHFSDRKPLFAKEISEESRHFPKCFAHVHHRLKTQSRLGHHARVAYTLFLKEIGLPLEESLKFWSFYYSKSSKDHKKCQHSWQENHKKFIYSINHLYGNAGGGKNYSAHGCSAIAQRLSNINDELTCPFTDIEDLDPKKQCFQDLARKSHCSQFRANFTKPSQYYQICKQL